MTDTDKVVVPVSELAIIYENGHPSYFQSMLVEQGRDILERTIAYFRQVAEQEPDEGKAFDLGFCAGFLNEFKQLFPAT